MAISKQVLITLSLMFLITSSAVFSRDLPTTVSETAFKLQPQLIERIQSTLESTGYNVTLTVLPTERALVEAQLGRYAMALYRQETAFRENPNMIKINPQVTIKNLVRVVSKDNPVLCELEASSLTQYRVAGVNGIRFFESYIYPLFKTRYVASSLENVLQMVGSNRIDMTYWTNVGLKRQSKELLDHVILCPKHFITLSFHSFLHPDYQWAQEAIEKAYRDEFGKD